MTKTEDKSGIINDEDSTVFVGIPTMALLPSRNFYFKVLKSKHKIVIPRKGKYKDIDGAFYSDEDGEFKIVNDSSDAVNLATITRVLFATQKYPDMEADQLFCPISLIITCDNVEIYGQVIQMLEVPQDMTTKSGVAEK